MTKHLFVFVTSILVVASATGAQTRFGASTAEATGAPVPAAARTGYTVGPQDVLKITVFDEPTLSGTFRVDSDGGFQYPMLGRVSAAGLTPRDVEAMIRARLEDGYVRRAQVSVDVEQLRTRNVFIVGEVRNPGKYPLTVQMTLIEALAAAGATTASAGTEVLILRPSEGGGAVPLRPEDADRANVTRVSLADLQMGRLSENVGLLEGDTLFVPKAERFFVTGQVRNPGAFVFERGITVLQAISLAGGLSEKGSNRRLKVVRTVDGKRTEQKVDLADTMEPGDTLVVPQRLL